jgi:porin
MDRLRHGTARACAPRRALTTLLAPLLALATGGARAGPPPSLAWNVGAQTEWVGSRGGLHAGSTRDTLLHAGLTLRRSGDHSTLVHASLIRIASGRPSQRLIGDAQTASNIDAANATRIYEFWYARHLHRDLRLRAGLLDLNRAFAVSADAGAFLNSSFGIVPSLSDNADSSIYPEPGLGVMLSWRHRHGVSRFGVFRPRPTGNAAPLGRGTLAIGEQDWGVLRVGLWRDVRGGKDALHTSGAYALVDATLVHARGCALSGFLQAGRARGRPLTVSGYLGVGLNLAGFDGRAEDQIGLAMARARLPHTAAGEETSTELTAMLALDAHLVLQPDVQWIAHPSGRTDIGGATVFMLRLRAELH